VSEAPTEIVDELYGAPPGEFIARRDALAKELRASDRAAADAVKKLRKPSVSAAAVNRLARSAPDDVEALLAAGEALRQAQLGGGDRDAIRAAARDEREAVEKLVAEAGKLSPAVLEEVRETLHAAATDEEARELVRRGVLTEARRAVGLGGFGAPAPASAPSRPPRKTKQSPAEQRRKEAERERKAEAERARKAEAERKRAARERVKEARAALREAEREVARLRKELERAEADAG
jgi:DNA repair exonuclease SbcCD ATPase subunit